MDVQDATEAPAGDQGSERATVCLASATSRRPPLVLVRNASTANCRCNSFGELETQPFVEARNSAGYAASTFLIVLIGVLYRLQQFPLKRGNSDQYSTLL